MGLGAYREGRYSGRGRFDMPGMVLRLFDACAGSVLRRGRAKCDRGQGITGFSDRSV